MKEQDRNKAWGFTLFGDDFRFELGGKLSLMGLYQSDMFFPTTVTFPASVAKFCMLIMYYEKMGAIADDIVFKVTLGDLEEPLIEIPVSRKDLLNSTSGVVSPSEDITLEDKERIFHSRVPIALTPFVIPRAGRLRVRAHYSDGMILKLGSIVIRHTSVDEFNSMMGLPTPTPNPS